jgi:hypothetical protein
VQEGRWEDSPADSAYVRPTRQQLYDELDRFHLPRRPDSTWGEWHYFNLATGPDEWWYVTYLIGGEVPQGRWGGRMLVTHRRPDGGYDRYTADAPPERVAFDTARADVAIGGSSVRQRNGVYALRATARGPTGVARLDLTLHPAPERYFPPVELRDDEFLSGYVVPALAARASGRICARGACRDVDDVRAYHDHNWGVWRDVTWEWGAAGGAQLNLLYGGVYAPDSTTSPFFLTLADSLGVLQVLRFGRIRYEGSRAAVGAAGVTAPSRFHLLGTREADSVSLSVRVRHAFATDMSAASFRRVFLQMRGDFDLQGRVGGRDLHDRGEGFFETYLTDASRPEPR